jgi:hypothetical protein
MKIAVASYLTPYSLVPTFHKQVPIPKDYILSSVPQELKEYIRFKKHRIIFDRLCGLVVRVLAYRSRGPGFDSRALQKKK